VPLIQKGAARLGFEKITAVQQDATEFVADWENAFDAIICDVPCSGYGIIRKKPDIRYKNPADMADLPQLHLQILKNQARYVKSGGVLIYSTCTLLRAENEDVFERCVALINNFKDYYVAHGQVVYENPSPGNKAGGITTLEEKSLGCVQKCGSCVVRDVLDYGNTV
jgi:16S rRNA (cytosine967-C5)-methyltransferase